MIGRLLALGFAALSIVVSSGRANAAAPAGEAGSSTPTAREVHLLPLGGFPRSDASSLARYVQTTLGVRADVLESARLPASAFDRKRKQYVAEDLFPILRDHLPAGQAPVTVIGLLKDDIYTLGVPSWRFAFGIRSPDGLAVVSRARMDPHLLGLDTDPALRTRRLQKMVTREVGVLALGRSLNKNPRSVLYDTILSTDDLDFMTDQFLPPAPGAARRSWLAYTNGVCERGIVENKALLARSTISTQSDYLAFLRAATALEVTHRTRLAAIPSASEDRSAVQAMLARFGREVSADRATIAKLSAHWSAATLRRSLRDGLRASVALKTNALELGSLACGRYFDPATYG